jgi:hypothetical protein
VALACRCDSNHERIDSISFHCWGEGNDIPTLDSEKSNDFPEEDSRSSFWVTRIKLNLSATDSASIEAGVGGGTGL